MLVQGRRPVRQCRPARGPERAPAGWENASRFAAKPTRQIERPAGEPIDSALAQLSFLRSYRFDKERI